MSERPARVDVGAAPPATPRAVWIAVLAAAALRLPFLAGYSIDDDEFYTLRNAEDLLATPTPPAVLSFPATFAATRGLIELFGAGPFALRLVPVLCGIGAVLALYRCGRRLVGERAAVAAALLLAVWPWHHYFSGLARYYAPLFLVAILALDAVHRACSDGGARAIGRAAGALLLAYAVHPTGPLAAAGAAAPLLARGLRGGATRRRALAIAGVLAAIAAAVAFSPLARPVVAVVSGSAGSGYAFVPFVFGLAFNVAPAVLLLALLGAAAAFSERRPELSYLLAAALLPIAALAGLTLVGVEAQQRYAMPAMPALLLLAGLGAERVAAAAAASGRAARVAAVAALAVPFLPSLASNLLDGNRHPYRAAAEVVRARHVRGDMLLSEAHGLLGHYLFGYERRLPAGRGQPPFPSLFGEAPPDAGQLTSMSTTGRPVRFVAPENLLESGAPSWRAFVQWLPQRAAVEARLGHHRFDYHRNVLAVLYAAPGARP